MFAIAAAVLAAIAMLLAFGVFAGAAAAGFGWAAVMCLAVHLAWPVVPWRRPPP